MNEPFYSPNRKPVLVHIARCRPVIQGGRHAECGETLDRHHCDRHHLHASAPRASAQTPNVVIQWNQTLQAQFVGTGPGIHIRALPMMHIAMFDAINSIEERYTPYLGQGQRFSWRVCRSGGRCCGERRADCALSRRSRPCSTICWRHSWREYRPDARDKEWESGGQLPRRFSTGGRTTAGRPLRRLPRLRTRHTCFPRSRGYGSRHRRRTALRRLRSIHTCFHSRC